MREGGEECDRENEACEGPQRCGGGVRRCLDDCTWGECEGDVFRLTAGPVTASGEMLARGQTNNILWTGEVFRLFFLGKTEDPDYPYGFESCAVDLDEDGDNDNRPFLLTPPSLVELEPWDMTAQPLTGPNPYAFAISIYGDRNAVLDFIDAADRVVLDPPIDLQGEDVAMAKLFASNGSTLAAIYYRGHGLDTDRVAFIDGEGELIALHDLPCENDYPANGGMVVEDDAGFTVFYMCSLDPYGTGWTDYRLFRQRFDGSGVPIDEPMNILAGEDLHFTTFAGVYMGSGYALLFHGGGDVPYPVEMKFAVIGSQGEVLAGPVVVGTIDPRIDDGDTNADIAWTGSEFGVAFAEWAEPPEEGEEMRTTVKLLRLDEGGGLIGEPLSIYGESHSHTVRMAWTGSMYGISWLEPFHPHAMGHLHFAAAGCSPPED